MPVPQHDDQSDQHDHDGANLDLLCGQRDCVPAFHPDTGDPLHDESAIAVREELNLHLIPPRDVTDDSQHVTLHVPFTAETKDPINEELRMKMPKDATSINVACPEEVHEAELLEDLSVQTDFCCISEVPHRNAEKARHDEGRQPNHLDSRTQNSSPSSCRVHIKRGTR